MFWLFEGSATCSQSHSHPGVGDEGSHCPDMGVGYFFLSFMHTDPAQNGKHTIPHTHTHTHARAHTLLKLCKRYYVQKHVFVFLLNQRASLVGVVRAKRKRKQTLVGQWQRD